jgi:orotate phosphoribosyltransferase-like protein
MNIHDRDLYDLLAELESRLFSTRDAADHLHISERAVRHIITDGKLKAARFFGNWYVSFAAMQTYAQRHSEELFAEADESARADISRFLQLEIPSNELPSFRKMTRR